MKKIPSWMNGRCKKSVLLFLCFSMCCVAFASEKDDPVHDFAQNMDYCRYMIAVPDGVQDEFESHYSSALAKALNFLQGRRQDLTMLDAMLVVRSQCEARMVEMAKVRTP